MCGDALSVHDANKLLGGGKPSMVFTDPPYNVDYRGGMNKQREGIRNDKMTRTAFYDFLKTSLEIMMAHCAGSFYVFMGSTELDTLKQAFMETGGHFSCFVIWAKNNFTLSRADWQSQYEPILYGWNAKTKNHYYAGMRDQGNVWTNLEKTKAKFKDGKTMIKLGQFVLEIDGKITGRLLTTKAESDVWYEAKPAKNDAHPTMKPVAVCAKAIRASSKRGEIVWDPFAGSGSTMIAAEQAERRCFSNEIDPKYVDVQILRYCAFTKTDPEKIYKTATR